ncbi:uncharacterized protein [Amphiura filiformis]|uniref:uncharacterized protein n=1 Tax=Amphiura filiformis TaxID=82378 RepID=UPI003B20D458
MNTRLKFAMDLHLLCIICVVLLFCKVVSGVNVNVSASPLFHTTLIGERVIFNCTADHSIGNDDIRWFNGSIPFPEDHHRGYQVLEDGTSQLVLSDVQASDSGRYSCCVIQAEEQCGDSSRVDVRLDVGLPPGNVLGLTCYSRSVLNGYCIWNNSKIDSHLASIHTLQRCVDTSYGLSQECHKTWDNALCKEDPERISINAENVCYLELRNEAHYLYRVESVNKLGTVYTQMIHPRRFSIFKDAVPLPPVNISLEAETTAINVRWKTPPGFDIQIGKFLQICRIVGYRIRYKYSTDVEMWKKSIELNELTKDFNRCSPSYRIDKLHPPDSEVCLQISSESRVQNSGKSDEEKIWSVVNNGLPDDKKIWSEWSQVLCTRLLKEVSTTVFEHNIDTAAFTSASNHGNHPPEGLTSIQIIYPEKDNSLNAVTVLAVVLPVAVAVICFVSCCCWKKVSEQPEYEVKLPSIVYRSNFNINTVHGRFRVQEPEDFDELCTQRPDNCADTSINSRHPQDELCTQRPDNYAHTSINSIHPQNTDVTVTLFQNFSYNQNTEAADFDPLLETCVSVISPTDNEIGCYGDDMGSDDVRVYYDGADDDGDDATAAVADDDRDEILYYTMTSQGSLVRCDKTNQDRNENVSEQLVHPLNNKHIKDNESSSIQDVQFHHNGYHGYQSHCNSSNNLALPNEADTSIHAEKSEDTYQKTSEEIEEVDAYVQHASEKIKWTNEETSVEVDAYVQHSQIFPFCIQMPHSPQEGAIQCYSNNILENMGSTSNSDETIIDFMSDGSNNVISSNQDQTYCKASIACIGFQIKELGEGICSHENKNGEFDNMSLRKGHIIYGDNKNTETIEPVLPETENDCNKTDDSCTENMRFSCQDNLDVFDYSRSDVINGYLQHPKLWSSSDDGYSSNGNGSLPDSPNDVLQLKSNEILKTV